MLHFFSYKNKFIRTRRLRLAKIKVIIIVITTIIIVIIIIIIIVIIIMMIIVIIKIRTSEATDSKFKA